VLVAVISDTHMAGGRRRLPDACVTAIEGADLLIHAGDVMTPEALAEIEAIGPPLVAVAGNMDPPTLGLPPTAAVDTPGGRIIVVHDAGPASGRLARLRRLYPEAAAVVFGHSHIPLHERDGGFQIFNPGSPTERRRSPRHTMGVARCSAGSLHFDLVDLG
jgi:putative phosphoesterase